MSETKTEYRIVNAAELKKIMHKYKCVRVYVSYEAYHRTGLSVNKRYLIDELESDPKKFDYAYEIDDNYEHTLYIERVIRTQKGPAGGTVDTPGANLVPR